MKTIIILGIARSGTSLLAGILNNLGVNMEPKKDLHRDTFLNKLGCYEDLSFLNLNREIVIKTGYNLTWLEWPTKEEVFF